MCVFAFFAFFFSASKLTMDNVPWHEEVVHFVSQLAEHLNGDYQISCEHEHSNCVLLTHKRFCIDGKWKTWIDYPKFHPLVQNYNQTGVYDILHKCFFRLLHRKSKFLHFNGLLAASSSFGFSCSHFLREPSDC